MDLYLYLILVSFSKATVFCQRVTMLVNYYSLTVEMSESSTVG